MVDSVEKLPVEISSLQGGESDPFSGVPCWSLWLSTIVLSLAFIIGLPLNGATVLIFWRRKKLRHLVNFVLLLDCLSHIVLCIVCIPIHLVTVWSSATLTSSGLSGLTALQQVVGNFCNVYSTFLTVSIAILRYRRLCWKKKDRFSTTNAIKWSVLSGCVAFALTFAQSYSSFLSDDPNATLIFYMIKISLIVFSMAIVFFCYIRLSQRVWSNAASHEKVMDPMKLKKSRSVHLRATIHSCVQIILIILTLSPHLYEQTMEALYASTLQFAQGTQLLSDTSDGSFSSGPVESSTSTFDGFVMDESPSDGDSAEDWKINQQYQGDNSLPNAMSSSDTHFVRLIGITINYALLILGTPMAYIASCHRFREQFTSILFSHIMNSPLNSAGPNANSPRHTPQKHHSPNCSHARNCRSHHHNNHGSESPLQGRFYSTTISRASGRQFSSSLTKTTTTKASISSGLRRNSTSMSTNNVSTPLGRSVSTKSNRSSVKRSSSKRKGSRGLLGTEFIIVDSESTCMLQEQDLSNSTNPKETPTPSPTMTDCVVSVVDVGQSSSDHSNGSYSSSGNGRRTSIFCTNIQSAFTTTRIDSNCNNNHRVDLHTVLQNYGYDFSDMGELV